MAKHRYKMGQVNDVKFINGSVSLSKVNLNVYAFQTDDILIDTGAEKLIDGFMPFFKSEPLEKVIITHAHEDHTGGAHYLEKELGLPIYMHERFIAREQEKAKYPTYRKLFWGKRKPFTAHPMPSTFTSKNGKWRSIYTPGHATDHYAYLNESTGQLFSGDLFVHPHTKLILRDESTPVMIQSLKKILTYDFEEMFCCHAGHIKNGKKAFQKKLDYLEEFEGKVLDLYQKGDDVKVINKKLFPKKYPIQYFSFGEWGTKHMITSILHYHHK